jgi:hypothetical protein
VDFLDETEKRGETGLNARRESSIGDATFRANHKPIQPHCRKQRVGKEARNAVSSGRKEYQCNKMQWKSEVPCGEEKPIAIT